MSHKHFLRTGAAIILTYTLAVILLAEHLLVPVLIVSTPLAFAALVLYGWVSLCHHLDEPELTKTGRYCSRADARLDELEARRATRPVGNVVQLFPKDAA